MPSGLLVPYFYQSYHMLLWRPEIHVWHRCPSWKKNAMNTCNHGHSTQPLSMVMVTSHRCPSHRPHPTYVPCGGVLALAILVCVDKFIFDWPPLKYKYANACSTAPITQQSRKTIEQQQLFHTNIPSKGDKFSGGFPWSGGSCSHPCCAATSLQTSCSHNLIPHMHSTGMLNELIKAYPRMNPATSLSFGRLFWYTKHSFKVSQFSNLKISTAGSRHVQKPQGSNYGISSSNVVNLRYPLFIMNRAVPKKIKTVQKGITRAFSNGEAH